jgi:hypothetical protein
MPGIVAACARRLGGVGAGGAGGAGNSEILHPSDGGCVWPVLRPEGFFSYDRKPIGAQLLNGTAVGVLSQFRCFNFFPPAANNQQKAQTKWPKDTPNIRVSEC